MTASYTRVIEIKTYMGVKTIVKKNFLARSIVIAGYRTYLAIKREVYLRSTKSNYNGKIFCIGYQKTGTTTLGRSLKMLGYKHSSFDHKVYMKYYKEERNIHKILDYTSKFESFDDLPWLKEDMIPILDKSFPNSKFIFLDRDEEAWKKSLYNWRYRKWGVYPDIEKGVEGYRRHKEFVLNYFKDRIGDDFISLEIKDKNGFLKLGEFLGKKVPMNNFPHHNKTDSIPSKHK